MTSDLVERGITRNAINNRLVQLEKLGLAKRCGKLGKWHLWRAVNDLDQRTGRADQRKH